MSNLQMSNPKIVGAMYFQIVCLISINHCNDKVLVRMRNAEVAQEHNMQGIINVFRDHNI